MRITVFLTKIIKTVFVILFFTGCFVSANAKEMALTFDDAPRFKTPLLRNGERSKLVIEGLKKLKSPPVVFYCNTKNFEGDGLGYIKDYQEAGHFLANHTHSHLDLSAVGPEKFWVDVLKAHEILKDYNNFRAWFRFPYLEEGSTVEVRDLMRKKLKEAGYINGYTTIDTADWYVDKLVQRKVYEGYTVDRKKLKKAYLTIMLNTIEFYEKLAERVLKRTPKHVLLLHETDLNALYITDLVKAVKRKGWKLISPDEAYKDELVKAEPDTLKLNQGRIASIGIANGMAGPFSSKWEDTKEIESILTEHGVFKKNQ